MALEERRERPSPAPTRKQEQQPQQYQQQKTRTTTAAISTTENQKDSVKWKMQINTKHTQFQSITNKKLMNYFKLLFCLFDRIAIDRMTITQSASTLCKLCDKKKHLKRIKVFVYWLNSHMQLISGDEKEEEKE